MFIKIPGCTRSRRPQKRKATSSEPALAKTHARRISSWTGQGIPELANIDTQPVPAMTQAKKDAVSTPPASARYLSPIHSSYIC